VVKSSTKSFSSCALFELILVPFSKKIFLLLTNGNFNNKFSRREKYHERQERPHLIQIEYYDPSLFWLNFRREIATLEEIRLNRFLKSQMKPLKLKK